MIVLGLGQQPYICPEHLVAMRIIGFLASNLAVCTGAHRSINPARGRCSRSMCSMFFTHQRTPPHKIAGQAIGKSCKHHRHPPLTTPAMPGNAAGREGIAPLKTKKASSRESQDIMAEGSASIFMKSRTRTARPFTLRKASPEREFGQTRISAQQNSAEMPQSSFFSFPLVWGHYTQ